MAIRAEALRDFIARAFVAVGMPDADAATVAALMTEADLQGSDGHGVIRLAPYLKRIRAGGINLHPDIRIVEERAATALVDGDNGMGHLVMSRAAQIAGDKAKSAGIGWAGARFSNHAGPASLYARMALPRDMIGLYFAVGNANHLPPWGGLDMLLSTNPIAVAIPRATRRRWCSTWRPRSRPTARSRQGAARRDDARRLDDRPPGPAAARPEAGR